MLVRLTLGISLLGALLHVPALAEPLRVNGITFSDELGGFRITGVSGSGTIADPFVVQEEILAPAEIVLVIKDVEAGFGNRVGTHHAFGFVLTKIVTNRTTRPWTSFALELREVLESYSPYGDGLSFGQASTAGRPYLSSGFTANTEVEEPYDSLSFSGGRIEPGGTVAMTFVVSDASPEKMFFLLQQPGEVVASIPAPAAEVAEAPARTRPAGTPP